VKCEGQQPAEAPRRPLRGLPRPHRPLDNELRLQLRPQLHQRGADAELHGERRADVRLLPGLHGRTDTLGASSGQVREQEGDDC